MNKDDILRMSREENQNGDEREEKIKLHSYSISATVGALICMVFILAEGLLFDRSTTVIWIVYCGMMFIKYLLDAIKLKKKLDIIFSVVWGLCGAVNLTSYIVVNIG